jgi:hypothetical protein
MAGAVIMAVVSVAPAIVGDVMVAPVIVGVVIVGEVRTCPVLGGGSLGRNAPPADDPIVLLL